MISSVSDRDIFVLFEISDDDEQWDDDEPIIDLWLMKISMDKKCKPSIQLEESFVGYESYDAVLCRRSIYFLKKSKYATYNLDSRYTREYELRHFPDEEAIYNWRFCEFQNRIYAFVIVKFCKEGRLPINDRGKVRVFQLNEEDLCWIPLSEHITVTSVVQSYAVSSPNELDLILEAKCSDSAEMSSYCKFIYRYDPQMKTLLLWKELESIEDMHLYVPDHLFM